MSAPKQNTPEWIEWRRTKIGASDLPIIMGESKWMTEYQLYLNKMGLHEVEENYYMMEGKRKEKEVRELLNIKECPYPFVHPEYDWAMASLDGTKNGKIYEIKSPGFLDHEIAISGKIPTHYFSQVQWQLFIVEKVLTVKQGIYVSYNPLHKTPFAYVDFYKDEKHLDKMFEKAKEFHRRIVEMDPPKEDKEFRLDAEWANEEEVYIRKKELFEFLELDLEASRKRLISLADGKSCKGNKLCLTKSVQKGRIDYHSIPELSNVDLERYRGKDTERWTITLKK